MTDLSRRAVASRTEKCWQTSVSLNTIGAFGPPGLLSAPGAHDASAAAAPTPAAPPRNFRRSIRTSSMFTALLPLLAFPTSDPCHSRDMRELRLFREQKQAGYVAYASVLDASTTQNYLLRF